MINKFWASLVGALMLLAVPATAQAAWEYYADVTVPAFGGRGGFTSVEKFESLDACMAKKDFLDSEVTAALEGENLVYVINETGCREVEGGITALFTIMRPKSPRTEPKNPPQVDPVDDLAWVDLITDTLREMTRQGGFGHLDPSHNPVPRS